MEDAYRWFNEAGFSDPFERSPASHMQQLLSQATSGAKRSRGGGARGSGKLRTGAYCLDDPPQCDAYIRYFADAIKFTDAHFDELWQFGMLNVPATPNPMNRNTFIKRRQATFGADYKFGGQTSLAVGGTDENMWPAAVRMALEDARARSSIPETLSMVHVNWYPDGSAGVAPHTDKERLFIPNMPIYSYTMLSDAGTPRGFQVYKRGETKEPLYDISLGHGDLLVMAGDMQDRYMHGVKSTQSKQFSDAKRINMTVRSIEKE